MNILILETIIITTFAIMYLFMKIRKYRYVERNFLILIVSILFFEFISAPMWQFTSFQSWAYIGENISWIIILGWTEIFMFCFLVVDSLFGRYPDRIRFWLYLILVQVLVIPIESYLVLSGIKTYAPVLANTFTGLKIPFIGVPMEITVAIPLFASLIICFYKYMSYVFNRS